MSGGNGGLMPLQRVGLTVFALGIISTVVFVGDGTLSWKMGQVCWRGR